MTCVSSRGRASDRALAVSIPQRAPYSGHRLRRTTQTEDGIFRGQDGAASMATVQMDGAGEAMAADLAVAVDPTVTPAPVDFGRPGGAGRLRPSAVVPQEENGGMPWPD